MAAVPSAPTGMAAPSALNETAARALATSRDARLDVLRGLTILIVVLGHVIMYTVSVRGAGVARGWILSESVIWAFHMPLFAYLSG